MSNYEAIRNMTSEQLEAFWIRFTAYAKGSHSFSEALDGLVCITMLDSISNAMLQVTFQHHLSYLVQSGLGGVDLSENILIYHPVDGLHLTDDFP